MFTYSHCRYTSRYCIYSKAFQCKTFLEWEVIHWNEWNRNISHILYIHKMYPWIFHIGHYIDVLNFYISTVYGWQIWQYHSLAAVHLSYIPYSWKLTVAPTSFKCSLYIFCRVEKKSRSNITHCHWQNEPQPGAVSLKPRSRQHTSKLPATPILGWCTNKISCATFRCDCAYSFAF